MRSPASSTPWSSVACPLDRFGHRWPSLGRRSVRLSKHSPIDSAWHEVCD